MTDARRFIVLFREEGVVLGDEILVPSCLSATKAASMRKKGQSVSSHAKCFKATPEPVETLHPSRNLCGTTVGQRVQGRSVLCEPQRKARGKWALP